MKREIKFRSWDSKEKRYIDLFDNNLWIRDDGIVSEITYDYDGDGKYDSSESPKLYILLEQYTGLKDKNGKEIYEGDIVKFYKGGEWVFSEIFWNKLGMWCLKYVDGYINNFYLSPSNYEVIGNIYEHTELLK